VTIALFASAAPAFEAASPFLDPQLSTDERVADRC
jgi:hypothetical protein